MGVLDGKVVLITGAGAGIGKACALVAAREGASVLVNDLGTGMKGDDAGSAGPAEATAAEIRAAGGRAIANADSVTDYDAVAAMVAQCKAELGGLHAIINPAGILRDGMFHKMKPEDWRAVIDVHLHGAFNVCRAAIEHFRDQQDGTFVLFTSSSGLIGNFGQANYAAAKMGVLGLSRILAMEGASKKVRSNVRMIASIPVTDEASELRVRRMREGMRPEQVAEIAVALCADKAHTVSGQILGARGNEIFLFNQPRPIRALARLEGWTPQSFLDHALPALAPSVTDLGPSATVFPWDAV
jgi:NAD(P)-dependent dehydrogenase (short-subunit alcohol dehydrogenase family)